MYSSSRKSVFVITKKYIYSLSSFNFNHKPSLAYCTVVLNELGACTYTFHTARVANHFLQLSVYVRKAHSFTSSYYSFTSWCFPFTTRWLSQWASTTINVSFQASQLLTNHIQLDFSSSPLVYEFLQVLLKPCIICSSTFQSKYLPKSEFLQVLLKSFIICSSVFQSKYLVISPSTLELDI